jgi:hypothetical protein
MTYDMVQKALCVTVPKWRNDHRRFAFHASFAPDRRHTHRPAACIFRVNNSSVSEQRLNLNIKLETERGVHVHAVEISREGEPPDVLFWNKRAFRYTRTDGVWDQKKHVYREATTFSVDAAQSADEAIAALEADQEHAVISARRSEELEGRKVALNLTKAQAELLTAVRERHGHASNKATIVAALDAFDKASALNNDALLALLAKRLRGVAPASIEQDQRR